jgi:hypothetical protein
LGQKYESGKPELSFKYPILRIRPLIHTPSIPTCIMGRSLFQLSQRRHPIKAIDNQFKEYAFIVHPIVGINDFTVSVTIVNTDLIMTALVIIGEREFGNLGDIDLFAAINPFDGFGVDDTVYATVHHPRGIFFADNVISSQVGSH